MVWVIPGVQRYLNSNLFRMEILFKRTTELVNSEIEQLCSIFNKIFPNHNKTKAQFINEFSNTEFGFSYHIILANDGIIVGAQSYIPFTYYVHNKKYLFVLSVDTMILEQYRNFDNIFDLWSIGRNAMKKEGATFLFGFPNENSYLLSIKGFGDKDIGDLEIYVLPYKIGSYFPNFRFFNYYSQFLSRLLLSISHISTNQKKRDFIIHKDRETFDKYRYKWFDANYLIIKENEFTYIYKIISFNGVKTAFLIDVNPLTKRNFDKAVRQIFSKSHNDFEIILYVGYLNFRPYSMIKIPKKYEPKTFHFVGKILNTDRLDSNEIFDVKNWDVNLSNYDLL